MAFNNASRPQASRHDEHRLSDACGDSREFSRGGKPITA
jgi:hypothetical protein